MAYRDGVNLNQVWGSISGPPTFSSSPQRGPYYAEWYGGLLRSPVTTAVDRGLVAASG